MTFRTKENGVAIEFALPEKPNGGAMILCDGFPTVPQKKNVMDFFAQKGFAVFFPRYHGSWESDGVFLSDSPVQAIKTVLDLISSGDITEFYNNQTYDLKFIKKTIVIGGSFGGSIALQFVDDSRVNKVISISPVIDYSIMKEGGSGQDLNNVKRFVATCYGLAYRIDDKAWDELMTGKLLNPYNVKKDRINFPSILLLASSLDNSVPIGPIKDYQKFIGGETQFIVTNFKGHLSLGNLSENLMRFITHWSLQEDAVYSRDYLLNLLKHKIKGIIGDNLESLIVYGSIQKSEDLNCVSDIDCVITLKRKQSNEAEILRNIFSDFPYKVQCKVFSVSELEEIRKDPNRLYLHTTGAIMLPVLSSALVLDGNNLFTKIPVSLHELKISIIQKIEQYLSRMKVIYAAGDFSHEVIDRWKKKTGFIIYDTSIILFGSDPGKLNDKINLETIWSQFDNDLKTKCKALFLGIIDGKQVKLSGSDYIEKCISCMEHCHNLLK